jgi:hypothetical protein
VIDVKEAIKIAKQYVAEVFEDEGVFNIGLEEIELHGDQWEVTIGFSRKWDRPPSNPFANIGAIAPQRDDRSVSRTFKIVTIEGEGGEVSGLSNRAGVA